MKIDQLLLAVFVFSSCTLLEGSAVAQTEQVAESEYALPGSLTQQQIRDYASLVRQTFKPFIYWESTEPLPKATAEVEISLNPDGSFSSLQLTRASQSPQWDETVLRALKHVSRVPKDPNGKVPKKMVIAFMSRQ